MNWNIGLLRPEKLERQAHKAGHYMYKQEVCFKKIIVEGYRAVGSLSSIFLLLLLFFIDFGQ